MQCESCGHENIDGAKFCASCGVLLPHPEGEHPWIGKLVGGRFRVTRVLGEGGMGVVYAGEQQMGSTVRRVAIKTLHPHLSKDPSVLARFHRECGTVAQLEHPNTIKVYDFGAEADGTLYIAMEFVDGRSLDKVIEAEGPLAPARVVKILKQVAGALDEAHNLGVVHRDLKPENVVLGERLGQADFVKVLDFGIAARSESASAQKEQKLTQQGMVLGTPPYMSPEQFTGQELDRRSDVYSLGIMAYEMLTCRLPFNATTPWQWATEHMTAQPMPLDQVPNGAGVPRPMREAVLRALSKDPAQRPSTAGAFAAELEAGLSGLADPSVVAPLSTARTEAMQAAPALVSSPAGRGALETGSARAEVPVSVPFSGGTSHALSATQDIEIPVKKSNTGPLVLLGAAIAAVGGVAFFLIPRGGDADDADKPVPAADGASTAPTGAPSVAEPGPAVTPPEPTDEPTSTGGTASHPTTTPTGSTKPPVTTPTSTPTGSTKPPVTTPTTTPTSTPTTTPTSTPTSTPTPTVDCSSCISSISSGDWGKASSAFSKCDANGQNQCRAHARREAVSQSKAADCTKVRAISAGARAMGANSARVDEALAKCK